MSMSNKGVSPCIHWWHSQLGWSFQRPALRWWGLVSRRWKWGIRIAIPGESGKFPTPWASKHLLSIYWYRYLQFWGGFQHDWGVDIAIWCVVHVHTVCAAPRSRKLVLEQTGSFLITNGMFIYNFWVTKVDTNRLENIGRTPQAVNHTSGRAIQEWQTT